MAGSRNDDIVRGFLAQKRGKEAVRMNGQTTVSVTDGTTAKEFLAQHDISKYSALAFIFDVPFIETVSGRAMSGEHGKILEDKDFNFA